jgi:hypothetical protein
MPEAYVPRDLCSYFEGDWRIDRLAEDRCAGITYRLGGTARFVPTPDGLDYAERVVWQLCGGPQNAGTRSYQWILTGTYSAELRFPDGRRFHALDLAGGCAEVVHDCPPDRYDGLYRLRDAHGFRVRWVVSGPRKDLVLSTLCTRIGSLTVA